MEKFLSIPVTNEQNQLVSVKDIKLIEQTSTVLVTITYGGGLAIAIGHAALSSGSEAMRDAIQNAVIASLQTPWTKPSYQVSNLPAAVSAIDVVVPA